MKIIIQPTHNPRLVTSTRAKSKRSTKKMECQHCGKKNPEGSRFCNHCGAAIVKPKSKPDALPAFMALLGMSILLAAAVHFGWLP